MAEPKSSAVSKAGHVTTSQETVILEGQDHSVRWIKTDQLQSLHVGDQKILFENILSVPAGKPPEFRPGSQKKPLEYAQYSLESVHDQLALNEEALKGNIGNTKNLLLSTFTVFLQGDNQKVYAVEYPFREVFISGSKECPQKDQVFSFKSEFADAESATDSDSKQSKTNNGPKKEGTKEKFGKRVKIFGAHKLFTPKDEQPSSSEDRQISYMNDDGRNGALARAKKISQTEVLQAITGCISLE